MENLTKYKKSEQDELFGLVVLKNKVRVTVGNNVVSAKEFDTFEDAEKYIAAKPMELIINTTILAIKHYEEEIKPSKKGSKKH